MKQKKGCVNRRAFFPGHRNGEGFASRNFSLGCLNFISVFYFKINVRSEKIKVRILVKEGQREIQRYEKCYREERKINKEKKTRETDWIHRLRFQQFFQIGELSVALGRFACQLQILILLVVLKRVC